MEKNQKYSLSNAYCNYICSFESLKEYQHSVKEEAIAI